MQTAEDIDTPQRQDGQSAVVAERAISQENVFGAEEVPEPAKEAKIVPAKVVGDDVQEGTTGEAEEGKDLDHREPTSRLLRLRLRVPALVVRGVGELSGGGVDDLDGAACE